MSVDTPTTEITAHSNRENNPGRRRLDLRFLFDNPIIYKQTRIRLGRNSLVSWLTIITLLCLGAIWLELQNNTRRYDRSAGMILGGVLFMMLIIATQALASLVTSTRATGMIDFHRLSPQSSFSLFWGFMIGGPIREYIGSGLAIGFIVFASILYGTSLIGLAALLLAVFVLILNFHGLSFVSAMLAKNPSPNATKGAAWGVVAATMGFGPLISGTYSIHRLSSSPNYVSFFGIPLSLSVFIVFAGLCSFVFFALASMRRMHDDQCPSLSKNQVVVALLIAVFLGVGLNFNDTYTNIIGFDKDIQLREFGVMAFLVLCSLILCATTATERVHYIAGLRRSLKLGERRPKPFQDRALNQWVLLAIALILTTGFSLLPLVRNKIYADQSTIPGVTSATMILLVLEFALALQYFRLRLGKHAFGALSLFLFVAWMLPLFIGGLATVYSNSSENEHNGMLIMSISPIAGIPIGSDIFTDRNDMPVLECRFAPLLPTLTAVFIFNMLITSLQRRIDRRILPDHRSADPDPFAWLDQATPRDLVSRKTKNK